MPDCIICIIDTIHKQPTHSAVSVEYPGFFFQMSLLDILEERSHDVSSYTRSAVLKAWISLTQSGTLPVERVIPVTVMAIDRLQDKTVIVRKQSLQVNSQFLSIISPLLILILTITFVAPHDVAGK